jgi:hypothetical protein
MFCEEDSKEETCGPGADDDDLPLSQSAKVVQVKRWSYTFFIGFSGVILSEVDFAINLFYSGHSRNEFKCSSSCIKDECRSILQLTPRTTIPDLTMNRRSKTDSSFIPLYLSLRSVSLVQGYVPRGGV